VGAGARVRAFLKAQKIPQVEIAQRLAKSAQHVSNVLNEHTDMPLAFALGVAKTYNVSLDWLLLGRPMGGIPEVGSVAETGEGYIAVPTCVLLAELGRRIEALEAEQGGAVAFVDDLDAFEQTEGAHRFRAVPFLAGRAAAGSGLVVDEDEVQGYVVVHEHACPDPKRQRAVRLAGDSMMPHLPDGSIVGVDLTCTDPRRLVGRLVCARTDEEETVVVKRLSALRRESLTLASHNPEFKDIEVRFAEVDSPIVGAVAWAWANFE